MPPRVPNGTVANCGPPFGTKRPQVQILSPRPVPQVADLRECRTLRAASHLPAIATEASGNKKEHEGTPGKAGADFAGQKNTRPPRTTAAQQGPPGRCDPPSATKRPFGRDVCRPGTLPIRSRQARQARDRHRRPLGGGSGRPQRPQLDQMSAFRCHGARPLGVRKGSRYGTTKAMSCQVGAASARDRRPLLSELTLIAYVWALARGR